ncbi:MAG: ribonuclease Z, partial [Planctomycetota bacterium]
MPLLSGIRIEGHSVGGHDTCIDFPEWKFTVDIGRSPQWSIARSTVLFTHTHIDHMGGVVMHAALRKLQGLGPPTYVIPEKYIEPFKKLFDAWRELDNGFVDHHVVPLAPGGEYRLSKELIARPFHSVHSVTCQGYGIWKEHRRLAAEFQGLPQEELRRLRVGEGIEITEQSETCEVAITGDTTFDVIENETVRKARVLVMEVTFLDDQVSIAKAREMGHTHLDDVIERADLLQNESILFTHFSPRYSRAQITEILQRRLPAGLRERVTPLLNG